ncbi:hypothetical protein BVRB_009850 [Beta vulgaris subsp. vulgaris]|uniref:Uncharacterized protein n=1 Tax=Beta vulgaris subsp. vulgaris TaxID=3555 RepID=A0A0J8DWN4_BETVV|nr:hypothetical protein BVRB_009850 [Beta vulgaris subsp. vulgaris]
MTSGSECGDVFGVLRHVERVVRACVTRVMCERVEARVRGRCCCRNSVASGCRRRVVPV